MSNAIPDCPFPIGGTPLSRWSLTVNGLAHEICLKEERHNAFGSIKDRVAWYILSRSMQDDGACRAAREAGVVDASSGNYGYALASIGQAQGLKVTIVTSASISRFNAEGIRKAGAELVVAEALPGESSNHARMRVAAEIAQRDGLLFLDQYRNPMNPECHARWTAPEVLDGERFDTVLVAASSGGTARGLADYLDASRSETRLVLVEPEGSRAFVRPETDTTPPLTIPGYGSGRQSTFAEPAHLPGVMRISDVQVLAATVHLKDRGFPTIGLSSMGVVLGAVEWLQRATRPLRVVCICADGAERYEGEMNSRYLAGHDADQLARTGSEIAARLESLTSLST